MIDYHDEDFDVPDPIKDAENIRRHDGLSLHDVVNFDFTTALVGEDRSAKAEQRWRAIGHIEGGPIVVLIFTYRGGKTRAISLRRAEPKERRRWKDEQRKKLTRRTRR